MKKIILVLLLMFMFPCCVGATTTDVVDVTSGLPAVSQEDLSGKVDSMATSIHNLAMRVSPQVVIIILVCGAALGIFLEVARKMIVFSLIGLAVIYWAPTIVSLWVGFIK